MPGDNILAYPMKKLICFQLKLPIQLHKAFCLCITNKFTQLKIKNVGSISLFKNKHSINASEPFSIAKCFKFIFICIKKLGNFFMPSVAAKQRVL